MFRSILLIFPLQLVFPVQGEKWFGTFLCFKQIKGIFKYFSAKPNILRWGQKLKLRVEHILDVEQTWLQSIFSEC